MKIPLSIIISVLLFINTAKVFAGYTSGPTGQQVNGYYIADPTVLFSSVICKNGNISTGTGPVKLPVIEGNYSYTVYEVGASGSTQHGYFYTLDGGELTNMSSCGGAVGSYINLTWSGVIKLDTTKPTLQVISPSNNANTTSSAIEVVGTAYDQTSGLSSVTVNQVDAQVDGNSFSATVPLVVGLNTISVKATDNAGHTVSSPSLTVLRKDELSANNDVVPTTTNSTNTPSGYHEEAFNNSNGDSNTEQEEQVLGSSDSSINRTKELQQSSRNTGSFLSSPTKMAMGIGLVSIGGLGLASFLGYVPYRKISSTILSFISK